MQTPAKWPGPAVGALERVGEPGDGDRGREAGRIDGLGGRGEEDVGAEALRDRGVGLLVAGVGGEVARVVELRRVDEQRDDHLVAAGAGRAHQRLVAAVEGAHRRHEADRAARRAGGAAVRLHLGDGPDRLHAATTTREAATSASKVSSRSGARSSIAARWRSIVASSPRATGPVRARSAPCRRPVLERGAGERDQQLAGDAGGGREPLRGALERDEEVGGDRGGGVVGGAVGVGDLDGRMRRASASVSRDGERRGGGAGDGGAGAGERAPLAAASPGPSSGGAG